MNTVVIEKNKYVYKGKIYEDNDIESLTSKCGKNIRVVILAENPLIKICEKIDININKDIEKDIQNNLIIDEDTLVDYIIDKKSKKIYIYSIKQRNTVSRILYKAEKMRVEPIQYTLISIIKKRFKYKKTYKALVKINNYLYFIRVQSGILIYSKTMEEREDTLHKLLLEELVGEDLLIDINLKDIIIESISENEVVKEINFINLKEKVEYEISKI